MKFLDKEHRPKSPYIPSQLSATRMAENWLKENDFSHIIDASGHRWGVTIDNEQYYVEESNQLQWIYSMNLMTTLGREELVKAGIYNPEDESDSRLMQMLEGRTISMFLKEKQVRASSEEEAKKLMREEFAYYKEKMSQSTLAEVKRKLVGEWINRDCLFEVE